MTLVFRLLLVFVAFFTLFYMIQKIRKSKMELSYSVFWVVFSMLLILLALFPKIAEFASRMLGIASPANLVFAFIIFLLLIKLFMVTVELSTLETRLRELSQELALKEHEDPPKER